MSAITTRSSVACAFLLAALALVPAFTARGVDPCGGDGPIDPDAPPGTPVVLTFEPGGFEFTSLDRGVRFDLDADGVRERASWTEIGTDQAFLVLDRDDNGTIDHGRELFGALTPQPPTRHPNGFRALAVFDQPAQGGHGDGYISDADAIYPLLRLWFDRNHDGVSQPFELETLEDREVTGIDLDYRTTSRRDRHGNLLRWITWVYFPTERRLSAVDVIFLREP